MLIKILSFGRSTDDVTVAVCFGEAPQFRRTFTVVYRVKLPLVFPVAFDEYTTVSNKNYTVVFRKTARSRMSQCAVSGSAGDVCDVFSLEHE